MPPMDSCQAFHLAVFLKLNVYCCSSGGGSGSIAAKDALGNDVKAADWLKTHLKGDRSLTQGLQVSMKHLLPVVDSSMVTR